MKLIQMSLINLCAHFMVTLNERARIKRVHVELEPVSRLVGIGEISDGVHHPLHTRDGVRTPVHNNVWDHRLIGGKHHPRAALPNTGRNGGRRSIYHGHHCRVWGIIPVESLEAFPG